MFKYKTNLAIILSLVTPVFLFVFVHLRKAISFQIIFLKRTNNFYVDKMTLIVWNNLVNLRLNRRKMCYTYVWHIYELKKRILRFLCFVLLLSIIENSFIGSSSFAKYSRHVPVFILFWWYCFGVFPKRYMPRPRLSIENSKWYISIFPRDNYPKKYGEWTNVKT